ncbi:hypothetical protein BDV96DRAFT_606456 [Lophiotrema nucula]|uniref:Uncharacterized protein n=1 Tax=Lophiotrema nucula TaxID=690887 RepID=A0A6A5YKC6_9PLEO|nr:hypothetical protein BDV96DRAFT_606456 [Lophiotrema nucula]
MADSSSRSLLQPHGDSLDKRYPARRSRYKTPTYILATLTLLVACIVLTVVILIKANQDPVKSWSVQPTVLLSLVSGFFAVLLGGLFALGVAITWWRSIGHGTTLSRLQHIHAGANPVDLIPALQSGSYARRVALVSVIVLLVKVSVGPLTQRSIRPRDQDIARRVDMNIHIAQEIQDGYYGTQFDLTQGLVKNLQKTILSRNMTTLPGNGYSCQPNGICEGLISAAGINYGFESSNETIDLMDPRSLNSTIFNISMAITYDFEQPILVITTKYLSSIAGKCVGTLTTDISSVVPATVWYPISIRDRTLTRDQPDSLDSITLMRNYTSPADARTDNVTAPIGPLTGLTYALGDVFASTAILAKGTNGRLGFRSDPFQWPSIYADTTVAEEGSGYDDFVRENCPLRWLSPTADLLLYAYDFSFRTALDVGGKDDKYKQSFSAVFKGEELWYFTDFKFLGIAVGVMILGIVATMSLLWGWWQLDRYVTLSPLETGKAFGAPILMTAGSEQEANCIIREIGHERVAHDGDELVWNGTVYATGASQMSSLRSRTNHSTGYGEDTNLIAAGGISPGRSIRGHRRGMSSISSAGLSPSTSSFEHSLGVSTKRWHDEEEEEGDISYRPRARSRSRSAGNGDDRIPLVPISLSPRQQGSPQLPPILHPGPLRVEPLHSARGARRGSAGRVLPDKRPLSAIEERNSP